MPANPDEAAYLIDKARLHLQTARGLAEADPEIAYDAFYGAARKALTAVLRQQGLRPTREGGHEVVIQAAEAQLVPPAGPICGPIDVSAAFAAPATTKHPKGPVNPEDVEADMTRPSDPRFPRTGGPRGLVEAMTSYLNLAESARSLMSALTQLSGLGPLDE